MKGGGRAPSRVVVTGAAGGIGRALAERLIRGGTQVVINDLDFDLTAETASEIGANAAAGDASSMDGLATLIDAASGHLGQIDAWFANAGIARGEGLEADEDAWASSWQVNTMAHVRAARLLVPKWVERGHGRFVVTASAAGLLTTVGAPAYSVTKHAAVAFAEWLSMTYRHRGVVVQAICPQGVETAMLPASGPTRDIIAADGALTAEQVAEVMWDALHDDRFLVLPHPHVAAYYRNRAADTDRWLDAMNVLARRVEQAEATQ